MAEMPVVQVQVDVKGAGKPALFSKTLGFNITSGVLIPAIWPFIPKHFRDQNYSIAAVTAWFTVANVALRWVTKQALTSWVKTK